MTATGTARSQPLPWNATLRPGMLETTFRIPQRSGSRQPSQEAAVQVGVMRRLAQVLLIKCGLDHLADDVTLVVSELTTNAIVHSSGSEIKLLLDIRDDMLRIAVGDGMPGCPAVRTPDDDEETGRGLQLVQWVAGERDGAWGTSDSGATTWCDLPVSEAGR